ncbi:MAG: tRNA-dihydrouridine synthase [Patescibacteria group bacterium]
MKNFWLELKKPILALAPMADVTDAAFRHIIAKYSKTPLDGHHQGEFVIYTEFTSADGLVLAPEKGKKKLLKNLEYSEMERPVVAQFFTSKPQIMEKAAALAVELGFDGVDINMGCPNRAIEKQGAGAALIKNPKFARELIKAAKQGAQNKIPVSVKTRLGYNKDELEEWLPELLAENPAAITIHARTRKEMSKTPARWERVKRAVEIRDSKTPPNPPLDQGREYKREIADDLPLLHKERSRRSPSEVLILGNGDVSSVEDAINKCNQTDADGAMLGRAIFGNPWLFLPKSDLGIKEKLAVLIEHTNLFEQKFAGFKSFAIMKKHYKAYLKDIPNTHELKMKLMEAKNASEVIHIVDSFLKNLN